MAPTNLKEFSVDWVMFGLLFFCLLTFAITFMFYNNPSGLGSSGDILNESRINIQSNLISLPNESDALLNITSVTDPEASYLGSRDSIATTYGVTGSAKGFFTRTKIFMGWILTGASGQLLIGVFGGLFGLVSLYWITKWIRNGI